MGYPRRLERKSGPQNYDAAGVAHGVVKGLIPHLAALYVQVPPDREAARFNELSERGRVFGIFAFIADEDETSLPGRDA